MNNLTWHSSKISRTDREKLNNHKGACVWLTGLSGSGKSTTAIELEYKLHKLGVRTYILDGDNIRQGLNKDLDFTHQGRTENIRRVGEVAKLFVDAGIIVITAFISPFREDRNIVRSLLDSDEFIEVYVECDIETCEERDPKGLYEKARKKEIKDFTGVSSPYEPPEKPELILFNGKNSDFNSNINGLVSLLKNKSIISG